MKRIAALMLCVLLACCLFLPVGAQGEKSEDVVILYTNDVHTYIDGPLSYDVLAAIKAELQETYAHVLLADAGDHIQGTAYGSMDSGKSIIALMSAAGYDVATLGNHEFDYGMAGCMNVIEWAEYPYVSANFYHESDGVKGETVLPAYVTFDCGAQKIAFVGITTPETFSKSTPAYFQNENGEFIYGISAGEDGGEMRADVQKAIDAARAEGATQIIALGHLGIDGSSGNWTSTATIAGLGGLDAFIDGHSHHTIKGEMIKDKNGESVVLTQTGEYFGRIGMMVIDAESGEITTDFIEVEEIYAEDGETVTGYALSSDLYRGTELIFDAAVKQIKDAWLGEIDAKLGEKIGSTEIVFDNYDADGNRLVRVQETNSGDFSADALYYLFDNMGLDVDVAIMNGGGVRNKALTGDITYKLCKDMHTFGNVACLQTVSGQQLLDALEWGARLVGEGENGGFLHVSGITYKIDPTVPNTTKSDEFGTWTGAPEAYRVYDVKIYNKETGAYEALDLSASYNLAGYNYTLRDLGDGYAMFDGAVNVLDYVMEDYMVLANYVRGFEGGIVGATNSPLGAKYPGMLIDYTAVGGAGRIEIGQKSEEQSSEQEGEVTTEQGSEVTTEPGTQAPEQETEPEKNPNAPVDTAVAVIMIGALVAIGAAVAYFARKKKSDS